MPLSFLRLNSLELW